jgi:hypothetical protein
MNENVCKECDGEVEVGDICRFCGASPEGFENCGALNLQVLLTYQRDTGRGGLTTDDPSTGLLVNPSTGLPMLDGSMVDIGGNAVGESSDSVVEI